MKAACLAFEVLKERQAVHVIEYMKKQSMLHPLLESTVDKPSKLNAGAREDDYRKIGADKPKWKFKFWHLRR